MPRRRTGEEAPSDHIMKSYDEELARLNNTIVTMGGLAESQLAAALQSVVRRDSELAAEVVANDTRVDQLEQEVEAQAIRLLALRQPMARDLRDIVSALKISSDLERICDYAANVAKRSIALNQAPPVKPAFAIPRMGRSAQKLVKDVIDAYVHRDADKAVSVWLSDEELDELYTSLFRELLTYMMEDPRSISAGTHLLFMAKNIERIGDHATNIAETIYFSIHGTPLRETRPKKDRSSSSLVLPGITGVINNDLGPLAMKPLVMIVEDEAALVTMLRYNLEKEGFTVCEAADGEEALVQITERQPDVLLLDWMLPLVSGIEVCRQVRRSPSSRNIPIIMLTARGEEADKIRGLNSGADDYITKPFSPSELVARVRAVLRRAHPDTTADTLTFADVTMDLAAHRVTRGARAVHLGPTEYRLLRFFLEHPGRVFSREQLLDAVWGHDVYVEPRTVDVHIRRLRKTLNAPGEIDVIRTVRSAGYALDETRH